MPNDTPQLEILVHSPNEAGGGPGTEVQELEVRPWREDWVCPWDDSLKGLPCNVSQLKKSRKDLGPDREARHHCWWAHERKCGPSIEASFSTHSHVSRHCLHAYTPGTSISVAVISDSRNDHRLLCRIWGSCEHVQVTASTFLGEGATHHCWKSQDAGPTSPGMHVIYHFCWGPQDPMTTYVPISPGACDLKPSSKDGLETTSEPLSLHYWEPVWTMHLTPAHSQPEG